MALGRDSESESSEDRSIYSYRGTEVYILSAVNFFYGAGRCSEIKAVDRNYFYI
jgi:hypothetical protein